MRGLFSTKSRPELSNICICDDGSASEEFGKQDKGANEEQTSQSSPKNGLVREARDKAGCDEDVVRQNGDSVHLGQDGKSVDWRLPLIRYIQDPGAQWTRKLIVGLSSTPC
jgi:hypothetical protein